MMTIDFSVLASPAGAREDLAAHHARHGALPRRDDQWLVDQLREVALTGRGGAHFPVARKWQPVLEDAAVASRLTVVVNASEGEPSSRKDVEIIRRHPHLVLDGAVAACDALTSGTHAEAEIVIWLHEGDDTTRASLERAIHEREGAEPPKRILLAPRRYVSGEATSVIRAVQSHRATGRATALPRFTLDPAHPWRHAESDGQPVLVHNCETMARIGLIARGGAAAYVPSSVVTVTTGTGLQVLEVSPDTTFESLLASLHVPAPSAVLLGGYGGQWVAWPRLAHLRVDPDALREQGLSLGAGIIIPLLPGESGLAKTAEIAEWMAGQSAKACGPCTFGLPEVARLMRKVSAKAKDRDVEELRGICGLVAGRGACRHPDGTIRMVSSALEVFAPEIEARRRR